MRPRLILKYSIDIYRMYKVVIYAIYSVDKI